jgi:hypothetical protein
LDWSWSLLLFIQVQAQHIESCSAAGRHRSVDFRLFEKTHSGPHHGVFAAIPRQARFLPALAKRIITAVLEERMKFNVIRIAILVSFFAIAAAYAEGEDTTIEYDQRHQGFYFSTPVYLYRTSSASGIQLGYQLRKLHFRLDASVISDTENGECAIFANPSLGVFYSEDWESKIRTYQGIAIGAQKGIWNSFEGLSYFVNFITGAEWFVFERKAIYLELGSGIAFPSKAGAFEGGTIIGGGIKCFF